MIYTIYIYIYTHTIYIYIYTYMDMHRRFCNCLMLDRWRPILPIRLISTDNPMLNAFVLFLESKDGARRRVDKVC